MIVNNQLLNIDSFFPDTQRDILLDNQNNLIFCEVDQHTADFFYLEDFNLTPICDWQIELENWQSIMDFSLSNTNNDSLTYLFTSNVFPQNPENPRLIYLYFSTGTLPSTSTIENEITSPAILDLYNYPNPFNPSTTISFTLSGKLLEYAELKIYNLKGQIVNKFEIKNGNLGKNEIIWNGMNESGKPVSSGIYFYRITSGEYDITKKMILMK